MEQIATEWSVEKKNARMYTPPQLSGQDFAPSQVENVTKSHEILGNAFAPKMECADKCEGRIRVVPGLCTWGHRARTLAARSFKQSPCLVDERSNGRTTPQCEC
jgi:hypothetical protein